MSNDPKYYDIWEATDGMLPAPCRLSGQVNYQRPNGGGWGAFVTVVGWGPDAKPLILLSDGGLGGLSPNMTLSDVQPV